jgi:hypothetical protein
MKRASPRPVWSSVLINTSPGQPFKDELGEVEYDPTSALSKRQATSQRHIGSPTADSGRDEKQ